MKFSEVHKKASPNLFWRHDAGAGLQLYGDIPQEAKNHVEYTLKSEGCRLFTLITPEKSYENKGMAAWVGQLGYEHWMQFPPRAWDEMQTANAQVMTHATKVLPSLISGLQDALADSAKYPQLKLPKMHEERLRRLLELAEDMNEKKP